MQKYPILTEINNGILSTKNAMPQKDLTSDNNSTFEMNRKIFTKTYYPTNSFSNLQSGTTMIEQSALGLANNKIIISGGKSILQKKWIGGNRDASQIIKNRRVYSTGSGSSSGSGSTSFKNVKDNNTARDALVRTRAGGYVAPPKVTQKNVPSVFFQSINPINPIQYYRIVSAGLQPITQNNGQISGTIGQSGSAFNVKPGVYSFTDQNPTNVNITPNMGRSYNVVTISRTTGITNSYVFDVFGNSTNIATFTDFLNGLDNTVIVIIYTYDEPQKTGNGATIITNQNYPNLVTKITNCGASTAFPSSLNYRSSYVLIGIPGIGTGNGYERFKGGPLSTYPNGDPSAWLDITISVVNGQYTYISG